MGEVVPKKKPSSSFTFSDAIGRSTTLLVRSKDQIVRVPVKTLGEAGSLELVRDCGRGQIFLYPSLATPNGRKDCEKNIVKTRKRTSESETEGVVSHKKGGKVGGQRHDQGGQGFDVDSNEEDLQRLRKDGEAKGMQTQNIVKEMKRREKKVLGGGSERKVI